MHILSTSIAAFILGTTTVAAMADKLPKGAIPLSADEVRAIYSGKTGVYSVSDIYYDPNGTTKGVFGKPKATNTFKARGPSKATSDACTTSRKAIPRRTPTAIRSGAWARSSIRYGRFTMTGPSPTRNIRPKS
ncbi:hypothetical protein RFM26_02740 [Mesorhizobium sp. VK23B]|uniref:Uncharacterized protein n=1 Tax=Mesorhizobium dulcispinae TaxID=3072316 RepID=A0ABU4X959_9HYPH|nr:MULTISPECIES: hypothetical protein [unclassified Mesorhizobium]MDX8464602.1 hypothetical protein [Mesorhizobium sp. VK23B]MDX8470988.1 hypothetical protein [Mesorhizobium sp. VK23A]